MATKVHIVGEASLEHGLLLPAHHVHLLPLVLVPGSYLLHYHFLCRKAFMRSFHLDDGASAYVSSTNDGVQPENIRGYVGAIWWSNRNLQLGSE